MIADLQRLGEIELMRRARVAVSCTRSGAAERGPRARRATVSTACSVCTAHR